MILVVDNYDSFTFNLVQYLGELGAELEVHRNDTLTVDEARAMQPQGILLGPGPGGPTDAGITLALLASLTTPMLGVCLGHQSMVHAEGGQIVRAERLMHGRTSPVLHDGKGVFDSLPSPFVATRYHSLIADRATLPSCFDVSAWTKEGEVMGVRHREKAWTGVQFHPESFLTEHGHKLLSNWLESLR